MTPKILAFAGSLRTQSFNKKLLAVAAAAARQAGAEVTVADLRDYPMPIFDEDLETASGMPETAQRFKRLMLDHHAFLIASPEYNSSITAVLKNTIDWCSRKGPNELAKWPFAGKSAALISASPGGLGGLRGLVHLRSILGNIDVLVLPTQVCIVKAHEAFDGPGQLKDSAMQERVAAVANELVAVTRKINASE